MSDQNGRSGCALPFASWRGLVKNILIALVVTYAAIAGAIVMGMVFHLASSVSRS